MVVISSNFSHFLCKNLHNCHGSAFLPSSRSNSSAGSRHTGWEALHYRQWCRSYTKPCPSTNYTTCAGHIYIDIYFYLFYNQFQWYIILNCKVIHVFFVYGSENERNLNMHEYALCDNISTSHLRFLLKKYYHKI